MNYIFDTEFFENGHTKPIIPISLGMVCLEDDRSLYIENSDVYLSDLSQWLKDNVVPHLTWPNDWSRYSKTEVITDHLVKEGEASRKGHMLLPHHRIGPEILNFLKGDTKPRFWAYFADYDWVVFCQFFGSMIELPKGFPMFCRDIKQEMKRMGVEKPALGNKEAYHNAIGDARKAKEMLQHLISKGMELF